MVSITARWVFQVVLVITHIVGLLVFLKGFFPSKVVLPGHSEFNGSSPFATSNKTPPKPQFDKLVLMVVDAMRADFMFSEDYSDMAFLHSLINLGSAIPYTAFSNPPTVTLPRLKGITTGGAPSFLDAILNIADDNDDSQGLGNQDSWVHQYKSRGSNINFFGDDTWLKLFPTTFGEFEGTNSFFVSDFTEVDNNVTRHLDTQLNPSKSAWDGLILHYLGLDHIGHKGGPDSIFMKPKQREMDAILKRLFEYAESANEDVLIVLMGDHGMNEVGNHGASSAGETNAGLTFISSKFSRVSKAQKAPLPNTEDYSYYSKINQIDLVPTLAALLDFPIPKNNLGIVIRELLELWAEEARQKRILWENCNQFMSLFTAKYGPNSSERKSVEAQWNVLYQDQQSKTSKADIDDYYELLRSIQNILASSATNYNYKDIYWGFGLVTVSAIFILGLLNNYFFANSSVTKSLIVYFEILVAAYAVHFHGSSLIEEEYQIWWYFSITSLILHLAYNFKTLHKRDYIFYLVTLVGLRLIRAWSNSGQKFFSKVTIGSYLLSSGSLLWSLIMFTYLLTSLSIYSQGGFKNSFEYFNLSHTQQFGNLAAFLLVFVTSSISFSFKLCQFFNDGHVLPPWLFWIFRWVLENYDVYIDASSISDVDIKFKLQNINIQLAQLSSYCILGLLTISFVVGRYRKVGGLVTDTLNIATLYLIQQTRYENIPIFIVFYVIKFTFTKITTRTQSGNLDVDQLIVVLTMFTLCMQNLSFFSMGNTNSLATVDLSNAYNGIKSYDVLLVGLLTWISNFAAPIYWSLGSIQILFEPYEILFDKTSRSKNLISFGFLKKTILLIKSVVSLTFYSVAAVSLIGSCINLRFHLFIWTVFSPKLLYFAAWSILGNFLVDFVALSLVVMVSD